ncbi:MAG: hypothetical protein IIB38_08840, partial [Candidatus Hydrogenedentes bacterium]|nr:hypothetical protein [Candidatus Hydrogenedentota bacterium]
MHCRDHGGYGFKSDCTDCKQQEGQEGKEETAEELKADTELGKKLLSVWMDHCSEDASSGDETLMADLDDGQLLFEAVIALNQSL